MTQYFIVLFKSLKKDTSSFLLTLFLILLSNFSIIYTYVSLFGKQIPKEIQQNIYEYQEVDLEHICFIVGCKYISQDNLLYKNNSTFGTITKSSDDIYPILEIGKNVYISNNFELYIKSNQQNFNGFVVISLMDNFIELKDQFIYIFWIIFILNVMIIIYNANKLHASVLLEKTKSNSLAYSNSITVLTENIHHELNTPLTVIISKFNKMKKALKEKNIIDFKEDCDLIYTSINQISDILNTMKNFKSYKNHEEFCLYDILLINMKVMFVTNSEKFEYEIDERLNGIKTDKEQIGNGILTSIFINLIKNSIEAGASKIKINLKEINNKEVKILFADDGSGVSKKIINSLFHEGVSTKNRQSGNGLWVNKILMNEANSDISLYSTSSRGSIFLLIFPIQQGLHIC